MSSSASRSRDMFLRQNSSPEIKSSTLRTRTVHVNRSKTPPPRHLKINVCSAVAEKTSKKPQLPVKTCPQRSQSKFIRSAEELSANTNTKTNQKNSKETLSPQDLLDLKYNAYLQTCLMVTYNKNVKKQNENKIANVLEGLQTKLVELDDKICKLDVNLGKILFLRSIKTDLEKGILKYQTLNDSINSTRINEYIHFLEQDLNVIRLKNFHMPIGNEITEVLKCFENIRNDLQSLSNVEEKTFSLSQLRNSIKKSKFNMQEEINLKNSCERKLDIAEEVICHELYLKSLKPLD